MSSVQDQKDLVFMKVLLESGQIVPKIDECYLLNKVAKALWCFEIEHAQGKVVINTHRAE